MKDWVKDLTIPPLPHLPPAVPLTRIALCGKMAVGKSYNANVIVSEYGYKKVAFAAKLKEVGRDLYGIEGKDGAKRIFWQEFSDDLKEYDPDMWTRHLLYTVEMEEKRGAKGVVLDDLRFMREAEILRDNGFIIIKVQIPESIRLTRINHLYPNTPPGSFAHASETENERIEPDYIISSMGLEAYYSIKEIMKPLERIG